MLRPRPETAPVRVTLSNWRAAQRQMLALQPAGPACRTIRARTRLRLRRAALARYVRSAGDKATAILRPEMRDPPAAGFNTTTPRACATLMQTMLLGPSLQPRWRAQLHIWMGANHPRRTRLRAAFPAAGRAEQRILVVRSNPLSSVKPEPAPANAHFRPHQSPASRHVSR